MCILKLLIAVVILVILSVVAGVALFLMMPAAPPATPTTSTSPASTPTTTTKPTTPAGSTQPEIRDVVPEGFVFVDNELYWRIKILGEADLRDRITINGIYAFWFGRIDVTLPDGRKALLYNPPDYVNVVTQFLTLSGEMVLDVYIPTAWYENPYLEGTYRVTVWLSGPYENRTTLFDKSFYYKMDLKATISPTVWTSWNQSLELNITNTGNLPLILGEGGIRRAGTDTVIGHWTPTPPYPHVLMPGESKEISGPVEIYDDFKEALKGKTVAVDLVLSIVGAPREYVITVNVTFPAK